MKRKNGKRRKPSADFVARGRRLVQEARLSDPKGLKRIEVELGRAAYRHVAEILRASHLRPGELLAALLQDMTKKLEAAAPAAALEGATELEPSGAGAEDADEE